MSEAKDVVETSGKDRTTIFVSLQEKVCSEIPAKVEQRLLMVLFIVVRWCFWVAFKIRQNVPLGLTIGSLYQAPTQDAMQANVSFFTCWKNQLSYVNILQAVRIAQMLLLLLLWKKMYCSCYCKFPLQAPLCQAAAKDMILEHSQDSFYFLIQLFIFIFAELHHAV